MTVLVWQLVVYLNRNRHQLRRGRSFPPRPASNLNYPSRPLPRRVRTRVDAGRAVSG